MLDRNITQLPKCESLPDPFLEQDGNRVSDPEQWVQRRKEIKTVLQSYEYGFMAPAPLRWSIRLNTSNPWFNGKAHHYTLTLVVNANTAVSMALHVYAPPGKGPFPVVVNIGDDASKAAVVFSRGYMFVTYSPEVDLDPDVEGGDLCGPAQRAYPNHDWGSLCVWAWAASRVMDVLQTRDDVQKDHIIIRGHSRTGKAALLAGAFDERFAMVAPNASGTGGASAYRIQNKNAETLGSITSRKRFASWFHPDFHGFAQREAHLPFDQHWLLALVAPRLLLITEGRADTWANPLGAQATVEAARRVFGFLGVPDNIGMHIRPGGHENLDEDYRAMLDFADLKFFGRTTERNYRAKWDPTYTAIYDWRAPSRNDPNCPK